MLKRTTWLKTIVLSVVVTVNAGCEWDNLLYNNFVDGDNVNFCPPVDKNGQRDKETFDYFKIEDEVCEKENVKQCVLSNIYNYIDCQKDGNQCKSFERIDYDKAFKMGLCPVGFECVSDGNHKTYCSFKKSCTGNQTRCGELCLDLASIHVKSCEGDLLECEDGYLDCDNNLANGCEMSVASHHIESCDNNILQCSINYMDCNRDISDGCETNSELLHIESCDDNTIQQCKMNYIDCNKDISDGCEINSELLHIESCDDNTIPQCQTDYMDCNDDISDGCEINFKQLHIASCEDNVIVKCEPGYVDCDDEFSTGCEAKVNNKHIVTCGEDGGIKCEEGYLDCDDDEETGCEYLLWDKHFLACENFRITECEEGYLDCNGEIKDGCEIDTSTMSEYCGAATCEDKSPCRPDQVCQFKQCTEKCDKEYCLVNDKVECFDTATDVFHCGSCDHNCYDELPENAKSPQCIAGKCVYTCEEGYDNIGLDDDVICVDLQSDPNHCGMANHVCPEYNECINGACVQTSCPGDEVFCKQDNENVCTDVNGDDVDNCGTCDYRCPEYLPDLHALVTSCNEGRCMYYCEDGYDNCGESGYKEDIACYDLQNDSNHCGNCFNACAEGYTCQEGDCILTYCPNTGEEVCTVSSNRVCVQTHGTDSSNCGGCFKQCDATAGKGGVLTGCLGGVCQYGCSPGLSQCGKPEAPICLDTSNDKNNCGSCGNSCATTVSGGTLTGCVSGQCNYSCNSGFSQCGTEDKPACYNLTNDKKNCGKCGKACPTTAGTNGTLSSCTSGACKYACKSGYSKCGGTDSAPVCYNLSTDKNHCGSCKYACPAKANAVLSGCKSKKCNYTCKTNYKQCGTATAPSCRNVNGSDNNNCGGCNKKCTKPKNAKSATCKSGSCKITCKKGYKLKNGKCV